MAATCTVGVCGIANAPAMVLAKNTPPDCHATACDGMGNVVVVVDTVLAWAGIGRLLFEGIAFRDFPVVQATVLLGGIMIVFVNLLVDVLYAVIDPRIRYDR